MLCGPGLDVSRILHLYFLLDTRFLGLAADPTESTFVLMWSNTGTLPVFHF